MAEHYGQAFALRGKPYAYTNWASAALLVRRLYPEQPTDKPPLLGLDTIKQDVARLRKQLEKKIASAPNFWDSAALADLDLVLAIAGKAADKPGKAAREAYRQAVQRGASVRECSSITEHLTFLLALIPDGDPIVGLIDQIKEDLA